MCYNTSVQTRNVINNVRFNNVFSWNIGHFKSEKNLISKGHMINRILHTWSFHMNFMNRAKGSFYKFHIKWPLV